MNRKKIILQVLFLSLLLMIGTVSAVSIENTITDSNKTTSVFIDKAANEIVVKNPTDNKYTIQLFDLTGKEITRKEILPINHTSSLSAAQLNSGIYLIRITPSVNTPSVTFKIMIN